MAHDEQMDIIHMATLSDSNDPERQKQAISTAEERLMEEFENGTATPEDHRSKTGKEMEILEDMVINYKEERPEIGEAARAAYDRVIDAAVQNGNTEFMHDPGWLQYDLGMLSSETQKDLINAADSSFYTELYKNEKQLKPEARETLDKAYAKSEAFDDLRAGKHLDTYTAEDLGRYINGCKDGTEPATAETTAYRVLYDRIGEFSPKVMQKAYKQGELTGHFGQYNEGVKELNTALKYFSANEMPDYARKAIELGAVDLANDLKPVKEYLTEPQCVNAGQRNDQLYALENNMFVSELLGSSEAAIADTARQKYAGLYQSLEKGKVPDNAYDLIRGINKTAPEKVILYTENGDAITNRNLGEKIAEMVPDLDKPEVIQKALLDNPDFGKQSDEYTAVYQYMNDPDKYRSNEIQPPDFDKEPQTKLPDKFINAINGLNNREPREDLQGTPLNLSGKMSSILKAGIRDTVRYVGREINEITNRDYPEH